MFLFLLQIPVWSCDANYVEAPTVFTSPNYPDPYPNSVICRTLITAPEDLQVLLYLREIDLEDSGEDCRFNWDILTVYDGSMEDENKIRGRYCGSNYNTPISIRSSGTDMLVVFKSDAAIALSGFEAAFYFVPGKFQNGYWKRRLPQLFQI